MDTEAVLEAQRRLYGAPLGEVLGGYAGRLGLTQARLASLLGVSPPMLSQLMNARRIKIGNPAAAQRLQLLHELAPEVEAGRMTLDELAAAVESTHDGDVLTTRTSTRTSTRERVGLLQEVFREAASASEHLAAAQLLQDEHPRIAELLRVYGAERTAEAVAHLEARVSSSG